MAIRTIDVRERLMERNDALAREVRAQLDDARVVAYNLISSPGAGKTTLLERTLETLGAELEIAIVTGDVQTVNDAERLARHTDQLVQAVVTGGACHLDAAQMVNALEYVDLDQTDLLMVENVGNLVCPAVWDLGEAAKIVVFSVTEGEDKPLKYPRAFQTARYAVLSKMDLLPHLRFDLEAAIANVRAVNPAMELFRVSAETGEGLQAWFNFLRREVARSSPLTEVATR